MFPRVTCSLSINPDNSISGMLLYPTRSGIEPGCFKTIMSIIKASYIKHKNTYKGNQQYVTMTT